MKPSFAAILSIFLACSAGSSALAQTLHLQDGRTIPAPALRRAGENILVPTQLGSATGDVGYPVKAIVRADYPEPAQIAAARLALAQGKPDAAISALAPALELFQSISEVPGGWWARLAILKAEALAQAGREADAAALLESIVRIAPDPADKQIAELRLTKALIARGKFSDAQAVLARAVKSYPDDPAIGAEAALRGGDAWLAQRKYEQALMAYLRVPALYFHESHALPTALLGSARAYIALKDTKRGKETLTEITHDFPASAEARLAAAELKTLNQSESQQHP